MADLEAIGATVLANACGPCIGQWKRADMEITGPAEHHRQLVQPQLPEAQRRLRPTTLLIRHVARHRHRLSRSPARLDFDPTTDTTHQPRTASQVKLARSPGGRGAAEPKGYMTRARTRVRGATRADGSVDQGGSCQPDQRPPAAARPVPGLGRQRPVSLPASADEGAAASAPPTTSRRPASGSPTAATSRTSRATCSSAR